MYKIISRNQETIYNLKNYVLIKNKFIYYLFQYIYCQDERQ